MIGDELLIPAVHGATDTIVALAQQLGPLPRLRSAEFLVAPDLVKVAVLLVLGEAWIISDGLLDSWLNENHSGGRYHRTHLLVGYTELRRRRYPPTGDRDLWVRFGPTGPPANLASGVAA